MHNVFVLHFDVYNYLEIDKNAKGVLFEVDSDFPEICPPLQILEIVSLTTEDDVKWKTWLLQIYVKFPYLI